MAKLKMKVDGMSCGACAEKVSSAISSLNGVSDVRIDLKKGSASATYDEKLVSEADMISAIEGAGFQARARHGIF